MYAFSKLQTDRTISYARSKRRINKLLLGVIELFFIKMKCTLQSAVLDFSFRYLSSFVSSACLTTLKAFAAIGSLGFSYR